MTYISNNLLSMKDTTTGEIVTFVPNSKITLPFGEYINHNEARLIGEDGSILIIKAGETIKGSKPQGKDEVQKFNRQVKQSTEKPKQKRTYTPRAAKVEDDVLGALNGN